VARSVLEQYTISDFLTWHRQKTLTLNPYFQRRAVWSAAAKSYLIDTILRQMPVPKIYMRTKIDPSTQTAVREVVDGQQRLRAILDFAEGKFALTARAAEFRGATFDSLTDEEKLAFLSYTIGVDQLLNATDSDVLEIFARLNSYNAVLKPAELRHAKYQGDFKWAVHESARHWESFWADFRVLTVAQRVRMADDSLMAELYGTVVEGLGEGGESAINKLYGRLDPGFDGLDEATRAVDAVLGRIRDQLGDALVGPMVSPTNLVMVFAAVAHATRGIPPGIMADDMPDRDPEAFSDPIKAVANLARVAEVIEMDEPPQSPGARRFWLASKSSTQRASSRRTRFPIYYRALLPKAIRL